ncbi:MAG: AAA family ATPase, partial [Kiritimatiellae bacterium]|nr:AAA family ATPase [Kiritimatiellia bacterium]
SNLGGNIIHETLSAHPGLLETDPAYEQMEAKVHEALRAGFRPEFLNRIDDIIIFHSLQPDQIREIVGIQVQRLLSHLEARRIRLELTEAAKDYLAREGYDPAFGARPLKRAIQKRVLDPLALEILEGRVHDGARLSVTLQPDEERLQFEPID